ncbi:Aspartic proteinase CDR1-like [Quillaja saponaria]|uniref:Aspartic proteinase CDR1-like n=1 Tax=Quillaja saponaria TaxID=32244 RepID=A0AAD7LCQ2_QUISA|nr:Aspartic proteinase CDR1-like [Quillaja saponaria]
MAIASVYTLLFFTSITPITHLTKITTTTSETNINNPTKLVFRLTYKDSVSSPYYNPNDSTADQANHVLLRSIARFDYLQKMLKQPSSDDDIHVSHLVPSPEDGVFLVNFSIGEPPVQQLTVMDTGSSLTWVKCLPCTSSFSLQSSQIFDPSKSSTYANLTCSDCNNCDIYGQCTYKKEYLGSTSSEGIYAREQLTFGTSDEGTIKVPDVIFGCSHSIPNFPNGYERSNGVLGLSSGSFSLLPRFSNKFSYCVGNLRDPDYNFNQLVLGDKADIEGDSTPINIINGFYYINLEDSGTDHTWLAKNGYEALSNEVQKVVNRVLKRRKDNPWMLCFDGIMSRDLTGFPVVTFHFSQGADLVLDIDSMFIQTSDEEFCMAVLPGNYYGDDYESFSAIGMMAQQNYNVGYDLKSMQLFFQRIDCSIL